MTGMAPVPGDIVAALCRGGLAALGDRPAGEPLSGGVSSDIWRVDLPGGPVCVKRALARLKVAADWQAPVDRNRYEAAWMEVAGRVAPEAVPPLLHRDEASDSLVMPFLDPARYSLWKARLAQGEAEPAVAAALGEVLARIHRATALDRELAARFPTDVLFHALRLEPYLLATAARHPDLERALVRLSRRTAMTKLALVHGDVSPKNILVGPSGPVLLDAECAWYGDPAFDLAFCLNHLLLKCLLAPQAAAALVACFDALVERYLDGVTWEPRRALEARTAALLPGLLLARVDGKSPVEYLTEEWQRDMVRKVARGLLLDPVVGLVAVRDAWTGALAS
ncbi:aminoglycoside phosphotransferase family protein [Geminicoccaceae bacterium 1502E]|nr:aminoglycoside phosphotransferase family protein [Geminicoccaceae bacterium 1502E]